MFYPGRFSGCYSKCTLNQIFLETPRARVTLKLTHYYESLAGSAQDPAKSREHLQKATDLISELQVETYSSMERREKTEFILEQMRILIALAQVKDIEDGVSEKKGTMGGGEAEWVKVRVASRKINESFLKEEANEVRRGQRAQAHARRSHGGMQDLKMKFYKMMIEYALKHDAYLDVAKYYHTVWETPSVKADEKVRGREVRHETPRLEGTQAQHYCRP